MCVHCIYTTPTQVQQATVDTRNHFNTSTFQTHAGILWLFIVNSDVIFPFSIDPLTFGFATFIIRHVKAVGVETSVNTSVNSLYGHLS